VYSPSKTLVLIKHILHHW